MHTCVCVCVCVCVCKTSSQFLFDHYSFNILNYFTPDVKDLTKKLHENEGDLTISDVCQLPELQHHAKDYTPRVTYFGVSDNVIAVANQLEIFQESQVFMKLQQKYKSKNRKFICLTIENVADDIFRPAFEEVRVLVKELKSGTITLANMKAYFQNYKDQHNKLSNEFKKLCRIANEEDSWITKCCHRAERYFLLSQYRTGAKLMQKFVEEFHLKGDFRKLDLLLLEASVITKIFIHFNMCLLFQ